jgi:hypothetical protein
LLATAITSITAGCYFMGITVARVADSPRPDIQFWLQSRRPFQVTMSGKAHTFDSFECAIHALARTAIIAESASSDTARRRGAHFIVASIAPQGEGVKGLRDRL